MTTYDYISSNNRWTYILCVLYPLALAILCAIASAILYFIVGPDTLTYAEKKDWLIYSGYITLALIAINLIWMGAGFYFSKNLALRNMGLIEATLENEPTLVRLVENLSITAGIKTPEVYVMDVPELNAFAAGNNPNNSAVVFTRGILDKLSKSQLEGVVAHEIAHIVNRDTRLMMLIIFGMGMFAILMQLSIRFMIYSSRSRSDSKSKVATLVAFLVVFGISCIFYYIAAPLIKFAVSRRREYLADSTAALLTRNPTALAEALTVVSGNSQIEELNNIQHANLCISRPGKGSRFLSAFSTHPPVEERIKTLTQMSL